MEKKLKVLPTDVMISFFSSLEAILLNACTYIHRPLAVCYRPLLSDGTLQTGCSAKDSRNSRASECGEMEVSDTTAQQQNVDVTPSDPCNTITGTEEETQPSGDCVSSNSTELPLGIVCKVEDDSDASDR